MEKKTGPNASPLQNVLLIFCVIGTLAMLVFFVLFASFYSGNHDKLILWDIQYARGVAHPEKSLMRAALSEADKLQSRFEWGGCLPEDLDSKKDTFSLHCWGLAQNPKAFSDEIEQRKNDDASPQPGAGQGRALQVVSLKKQPLDAQKKILSLLAAFTWEKLHVDITSPPEDANTAER